MFNSLYRLLKVFDAVEKIYGRKKLQKMVYLLEVGGADLTYQYRYHFYGPYSADLQNEVNTLVELGLIEEKMENGSYQYRITDKGKEFKNMMESEAGYSFNLDQACLNDLSEKSSQFLEITSTYAFLIESGYSPIEAEKKASELKPHLADALSSAISFYRERVLSYSF